MTCSALPGRILARLALVLRPGSLPALGTMSSAPPCAAVETRVASPQHPKKRPPRGCLEDYIEGQPGRCRFESSPQPSPPVWGRAPGERGVRAQRKPGTEYGGRSGRLGADGARWKASSANGCGSVTCNADAAACSRPLLGPRQPAAPTWSQPQPVSLHSTRKTS